MNKYELHTSAGDLVVMNMNLSNTSITPDQRSELARLNNEQLFYLLPSVVYTSLLMLIGTPGNGIVLYIYFFKWRKSTSRMFILFLTALDFVNCVTTLPIEIYIMRYSLMLDIPLLCKISRFATYTMNSASAAILVAIAVDRFKRICKPHDNQLSARKSKFICIGCILIALTLTWPALLFYGTRYINLGIAVGKSCLLQNNFDTTSYPYIYFTIMMGCTVVIFTILSILYYLVGLQIYRHRMLRRKRRGATRVLVEKSSTKSNSANLLKGTDSDDLKLAANMNGSATKHDTQVESTRDVNTNTSVNGPTAQTLPVHIYQELTSTFVKPFTETDNRDSEIQTVTDVNKDFGNEIKKDLVEIKADTGPVSLETEEKTDKRPKRNNLFKRNTLLQSSSIKQNGTGCISLNIRIGRSTLMLFLITLAYIISFLPYYTLAIIRQANVRFVMNLSDVGYMTYHVFLRSYQLSSAINPIIYSFCNAQFRSFVLDLFRRKSKRRHGK